jgi:6 kDa early secretory antigenic target
MSGDYVYANFGTLSDAQAQFMAAYTGLTSEINDLDAQLRSHLQDWQGSAQAAYYEAKGIWDRAIADMGMVIQNLSAVVGDANQNYQTAESTNASMFS